LKKRLTIIVIIFVFAMLGTLTGCENGNENGHVCEHPGVHCSVCCTHPDPHCSICCDIAGHCPVCCDFEGHCPECCDVVGHCSECCNIVGHCPDCCDVVGHCPNCCTHPYPHCQICCDVVGHCPDCCDVVGHCPDCCDIVGHCHDCCDDLDCNLCVARVNIRINGSFNARQGLIYWGFYDSNNNKIDTHAVPGAAQQASVRVGDVVTLRWSVDIEIHGILLRLGARPVLRTTVQGILTMESGVVRDGNNWDYSFTVLPAHAIHPFLITVDMT